MSWEKILTQLSIKDGASAASILTFDGSQALTAHGEYPAADTDTVALGLVNDGGTIKWTLVSDLGDAATLSELNATQTSLGGHIDTGGVWSVPGSGGTLDTASSFSDALDKLETAVDSFSGGSDLDGDYTGADDGDVIVWDETGTQTYVVESKTSYLAGKQTSSAWLDQVHGDLEALTGSGTWINTFTTDGSGDHSSSVAVSTSQWDTAYTHSQATHADVSATVGATWDSGSGGNITSQPADVAILNSGEFTGTIKDTTAFEGGSTAAVVEQGALDGTTALGYGAHSGVYDPIGTAGSSTGTSSSSFVLNNLDGTATNEVKLSSPGSGVFAITDSGNQPATLQVDHIVLTGNEEIQWEGNEVVASEFVAVNSLYDFTAGNQGLTGLYGNSYGLKILRDQNNDDATIVDNVKMGWTEKDAAGSGQHGNWMAQIIYSNGAGGAEATYDAPLAYKLVGDSNYPGGTVANPNDDLVSGGILLSEASEIGTMFVGSDSSLWVKVDNA